LFAWFLSITAIPAYIALMSEESFENYLHKDKEEKDSILSSFLVFISQKSSYYAKPILVVVAFIFLASFYGLSQIVPNDNTIRWFSEGHELRKADKVLNDNFAGSHVSYLSLSFDPDLAPKEGFRSPEVLKYMDKLQRYMEDNALVGKTTSVIEIVKTVHRELYESDAEHFSIPDSFAAVAQVLVTFEGSHRNNDLWHFITPDYTEANILFQLKNGDNQAVIKVESDLEDYFFNHPPPFAMKYAWFGTAHLNVSWQEYLVGGMSNAIISSFIVVLAMMILLYRSVLWGFLAIIPLAFTMAVLFGVLGLIGKDYDGSVAVLSAISLGLSVDYAIHFLSMSQQIQAKTGNWKQTLVLLFGDPARAISRNIIIVGLGFTPLLFSVLTPYITVGYLITSILVFSGIATLIILPALMSLLQNPLFAKGEIHTEKRKLYLRNKNLENMDQYIQDKEL